MSQDLKTFENCPRCGNFTRGTFIIECKCGKSGCVTFKQIDTSFLWSSTSSSERVGGCFDLSCINDMRDGWLESRHQKIKDHIFIRGSIKGALSESSNNNRGCCGCLLLFGVGLVILISLGYSGGGGGDDVMPTPDDVVPKPNNETENLNQTWPYTLNYPLSRCGDLAPTATEYVLYPVYIEGASLNEIRAFCQDAFVPPGQSDTQIASFTSEEKAQVFAGFISEKLGSARVGDPMYYRTSSSSNRNNNTPSSNTNTSENSSVDSLVRAGNQALADRDFDKAIASYDLALQRDPQNLTSNINLGLANYEKGQYQNAYNSFQKALNISPGHPEALLATATIIYHHSTNQSEETRSQAVSDARSAISQDARYSDLSFLRENLWGNQLVVDTAEMFGYIQSSSSEEEM